MSKPSVPIRICLLIISSYLSACAMLPVDSDPAVRGQTWVSSTAERECLDWYEQLDRQVLQQGVRDAMHSNVAGLPFLRVDRLLASFAGQSMTGVQTRFWVEQMLARDQSSRKFEIRKLNSPPADRLGECGAMLSAALLRDATAIRRLREVAVVPDDYSTWMRTLGLYPLTRWPFFAGVRAWQNATVVKFQDPAGAIPDTPAPGRRLLRYAVPPASVDGLPELMARSRNNPLGIPLPDANDLERLLALYAPVLELEVKSAADLPGEPYFADVSSPPSVDTSKPVMTVRTLHTRVAGSVLLQLVYTVWFAERPKAGWFDLLGGKIDALTWRVTLDDQGRAWVFDSIHACGCYHLFFPGPNARVREQARADRFNETVFVPKPVEAISPDRRIVLRVAADTHYLQQVSTQAGPVASPVPVGDSRFEADRPIRLIDEDQLRAMRAADQSVRSWYGPDGLVGGTERGERFLFWPMGIASAGAMRQTGRQATAFVGIRHFDDADLFERYFELLN